jgi:Pyruvate/2-oxoacid:ferredoxin oxidoreductase delta subunit
MRRLEEMHNEVVDRRAFLRWLPRQMAVGVKGLIAEPTPSAHGRALAVLDASRCLAWSGGMCQLCYLRCPLRDEAIVLDDGRPLIVASACDGCGICVEACGAVNDLRAMTLASV